MKKLLIMYSLLAVVTVGTPPQAWTVIDTVNPDQTVKTENTVTTDKSQTTQNTNDTNPIN